MIRKTYGVPGKIETVMIVKAGQTSAIINFNGGSIVDFARKPASYSTSDPLYQAIIENSVQFARGEIKLINEIELPDDSTVLVRNVGGLASSRKEEQRVSYGQQENVAEGESAEPTDEEQPVAAAEGVQIIKVACKADAVEWLKEHYPEKGYNGNNLRGKEAFAAACAENGVKFEMAEQ